MARIQWIEFHDQAWFPRTWRDTLTSFLRFMAAKTGQAAKVAPVVAEVIERHRATRVVDLCAGGGGPTPAVVEALAKRGIAVEVTLTDLHPNLTAFEEMKRESGGKVGYSETPVDATAVPASLTGVRTIFNAFHHFPPELAKRILANARKERQPIVVVELVGRTVPMTVGISAAPLAELFVTPLLRPLHWTSLVFTYLLPILPLVTWHDGVVSCLRVYSPKELEALVADEQDPGWRWSTRTVPMGGPAYATILVGEPV